MVKAKIRTVNYLVIDTKRKVGFQAVDKGSVADIIGVPVEELRNLIRRKIIKDESYMKINEFLIVRDPYFVPSHRGGHHRKK